jgi:uracil-DNA glycosylase
MNNIRLDQSWKSALTEEFSEPYWQELTSFVRDQYQKTKIYPPAPNIFRAFDLVPFNKVKVVIIGQDPYHGPNQANGLSFAVNDGVNLPPSLQNIFKEIKNDLQITPIPSGDLTRWANQGVLMLNSVLTVAAGSPASHKDKGWETFTTAAIKALNDNRENIVYLLWGKYAQVKGEIIDRNNNLVLASAHPSPYSASMFFNNHHFSKTNQYLKEHNLDPVDWK